MIFKILLVSSFTYVFCVELCCAAQAYQLAALKAHNARRALHQSTPPLVMDETLNANAVKCAQYYAQNKKFDHSCPYKNGAGENLYGIGGTPTADQVATGSTKSWYDEISKYNYNQPGFGMDTGHFTQVVWKNTKGLGFGFFNANNGYYAIGVGLYNPPGNYGGQFPQNVLRPIN